MKIIIMTSSIYSMPIINKLINNKHKIIYIYNNNVQDDTIKKYTDYYYIKNKKKKMNNEYIYKKIKKNIPDMIIIISYGIIISKKILKIPKYGCINIHPSNLPQFKGNYPVQKSILNTNKYIILSIIIINQGIDTGNIISKNKINIYNKDNFNNIYYKLSIISLYNIMNIIKNIKYNNVIQKQQMMIRNIKMNINIKRNIINFNISLNNNKILIKSIIHNPGIYMKINNNKIKLIHINIIKCNNKIIREHNYKIINCKYGIIIIDIIIVNDKKKYI